MPLGASYNVNGAANEQPVYQMLWDPIAVNNASTTTAITYPSGAFTTSWVVGAALQLGLSGTSITAAGTNWSAGSNTVPPAYSSTAPVGDDYGGVTAPYTIQTVDLAAAAAPNLFTIGVLLGVGTPGANPPVAPNTVTGRLPAQIAMVGKRGICQVLVDNTTTVGHSLILSSSHTGMFSDSGATTRTFGTTLGILLQAVTVSTSPILAWAYVNFPF